MIINTFTSYNLYCWILVALLVGNIYQAEGQSLPNGFYIENVASGGTFTRPVSVDFSSDGKIFVAEKDGFVYVVENGQKFEVPVLDISEKVLANEERGLLSIALDPQFSQSGFLYLLYTVDLEGNDENIPGFGRISRFALSQENPYQIDSSSEFILMGNDFNDGLPHCLGQHVAGSLRFGTDGSLLVSVGDNASGNGADGGGSDNECYGPSGVSSEENIGAFRSQRINSYAGKILRVDPSSGLGLPSNPFFNGDSTSIQSKVWAYGLRNPFRFAIRNDGGSQLSGGDPGTLFIGDVGWSFSEELNVSHGGENFGWPCYEGNEIQTSYFELYIPESGCTFIGDTVNPSPVSFPVLRWNHPEGGSSIAGDFYIGTKYPEHYSNSYFHADYQENWLKVIHLKDSITIDSIENFSWDFSQIVEIKYNPYSDYLYIVQLGGKVYRLRNTQELENSPPIAEASASPPFGTAPLTVSFFGTKSYDPNGDSLTYVWQFGDGSMSTMVNPTHTYMQAGTYIAKLTVTDSKGESSFFSIPISAGNNNPKASIVSPRNGAVVSINETLALIGSAQDEQDSLNGLSFKWEASLIHNTHEHPNYFSSNQLVDSIFIAKHGISNEVNYVKIQFMVTDNGGLSDTATHYLVVDHNEATDITDEGLLITSKSDSLQNSFGDLEVIHDDVFPESMGGKFMQFETLKDSDKTEEDWVGYEFEETRYFSRIIFQEGIQDSSGGFFDDFRVEIKKDNAWEEALNLNVVKRYEGLNSINFETYHLLFEATVGDAIRIIGSPGGMEKFISVGELRVFGLPYGDSYSLIPMEDAYTNNSFPEQNYGDKTQLIIRNKPTYGYTSLLKFDVSKFSKITNAILRIYGQNEDSDRSVDVGIYATSDEWEELGVTYDSLPLPIEEVGNFQVTESSEYYQVDVSDFFKQIHQQDGVGSLFLQSNSPHYDRVIFRSKEDAAFKPELVLFGETQAELAEQQIILDSIPDKYTDSTPFVLIGFTTSGLIATYSVTEGPAFVVQDTVFLTGKPGKVTIVIPKESQQITFSPINQKNQDDSPFNIAATSSSGLPVSFRILSGPATLINNIIALTGMPGSVIVEAYQKGNEIYMSAPSIQEVFSISELDQVKLRIYGSTEEGSMVRVGKYGVGDQWAEDSIHYMNAPMADTQLLSTMMIPKKEGYYEWEITEYVQAQLQDDQIVSLILVSHNKMDDRAGFKARENDTSPPQLVTPYTNLALSMGSTVSFSYGLLSQTQEEVIFFTRESGKNMSLLKIELVNQIKDFSIEAYEEVTDEPITSFYPNPFKDQLIINVSSEEEGMFRARLVDIYGRIVWRSSISPVNEQIYVRENLSVGVYMLEVRIDNQLLGTYKVIRSN